jgi:hypothetical protein
LKPESVEAGTRRRVWPIFMYFAGATIMLELSGPGGTLLDLGTAYLLQVRLHASAMHVSVYRVVSGLPLYGAIVFGLTRDLWNPLGLRDRGYLRVFSIVATGVLVWLAFTKLTYASLLVGMMLLGCCSMLMAAAQQGLMALVAQEQFMSGRLAAVFSFCAFLPFVGGALFAGSVADSWQARELFLFVSAPCQRVRFGRLGAWSLLISAPLCLGLPAMHSTTGAMWFAVPLGLASGAAYATLYDVAMRACPPGLHGTLMMAVTGANNLGWRAGDTFGVWLY